MQTERKLVFTSNGRWGFAEIPEDPDTGLSSDADEFSCGERIEILIGKEWYPGRFEAFDGQYYIILAAGFSFIPMRGTLARRPTRF